MKTILKARRNSADQMMLNVASSLLRDFQINLNDPSFCSDLQVALRTGDIARIRKLTPVPTNDMDVATYKATYQMQSVLKRYRFRKDIYSDQELEDMSIQTFLETQDRLANVDFDLLDLHSKKILDRAARYVARVLGPYSDEECRTLSRFGRKASVGVPANVACEAAKWELPLSGSFEQITWFNEEMSEVECVQEYWTAQLDRALQKQVYQVTDSLRLTLVPKTFKSLRAIMPNTTIGSYQSQGIGEMIRKRLKREGYDISSLQQRHRSLAQTASIYDMHTTADLSNASDSITVALVKRLLPPDWFETMNLSRIGTVELPNGQRVESLTFCTMGIGYTFPLQTLVFLALLKAIEAYHFHASDRRLISVYGDDMIYASRMHPLVLFYFSSVGFVINLDKTYHSGNFKESCGGDYYRGVDVRPFQPRNGAASIGDKAYEAMLYKFTNGLLVRWSEHEIGNTLNFLVSTVCGLVNKVKVVPGDYPDDAGVKCVSLGCYGFLVPAVRCQPKHIGHGVYRFSFLRLVPGERKELRHAPYLWLALRGGVRNTDIYSGRSHQDLPVSHTARLINELAGVTGDVSSLITHEDTPSTTTRSKLTGRRLRRTSTFVTVSHSGRYTRQSGTSCFEDRR